MGCTGASHDFFVRVVSRSAQTDTDGIANGCMSGRTMSLRFTPSATSLKPCGTPLGS